MSYHRFFDVTPQHRKLVESVREELCSWRKFLIAVDGRDGAGKSTVARFLAWQMGMPAIETDLLLNDSCRKPAYHESNLRQLLDIRLSKNQPVIGEGVFLSKTLKNIYVNVDYLIYVENQNYGGSAIWKDDFVEYERDFAPKVRANFTFSWSEE